MLNSRDDKIRTCDHTPPRGLFYDICILYLFDFQHDFIDNQLFNFYKFSSVLMVFTQNVVDLL